MMANQSDNMANRPEKQSGIGRKELREKFENGKIPIGKDFSLLIDSMVNELDDGFKKDLLDGFVMVPPPDSNRILSFKREINEKQLFFSIEKDEDKIAAPDTKIPAGTEKNDPTNQAAKKNADEGGGYLKINPEAGNDTGKKGFYFHKNGSMGIGKTCEPIYKMEVNGFLAVTGRVGSYKADEAPPADPPEKPKGFWKVIWNAIVSEKKTSEEQEPRQPGQAPADGKWHMIIDGLDNCNAFEIVARAGRRSTPGKSTGKFALIHAVAVASFGNSHSRIRKTSSHYGFFWNKISLKWIGDTHKYSLWVRTNSHYGVNEKIFYRITKLWDDALFTEEGYYYEKRER